MALAAGLALFAVTGAAAQHDHPHPHPPAPAPTAGEAAAPNLELFALAQEGVFEIFHDAVRLGTEEYRVYRSPSGDSLVTASTVKYQVPGQSGPVKFEKRTLLIQRAQTAIPLLFQAHEVVGEQTRALNTLFQDTLATVFRESEGHGVAQTIGLPLGRVYVLDPNIYQHVEQLLGDFSRRGLQSRTQNVFVPSRNSVVEVKLTRRGEEKVKVGGKERTAVRVEMHDDVTLIVGWMDADGQLLRLEAPAQKVRVERLPQPPAEAAAAKK